jgi:L-2,4-diaminobutyrate decarboxylase
VISATLKVLPCRSNHHTSGWVPLEGAHLSIAKAAHILGLKYLSVPIDVNGSMDAAQLPTDLSKSALVITAEATRTGAIDPFDLASSTAWTHVDPAWAGLLRA